MDFIVKLPKSSKPRLDRLYNSILVIVDRLTKVVKFILMEETIIVEELAYEVTKALILDYRLLE